MDNVGGFRLPLDPAELLLHGALGCLNLATEMVRRFPWPVKLIVAIAVCLALWASARARQQFRRH